MDIQEAVAELQDLIDAVTAAYQGPSTVRRFFVVAAEIDKGATQKADPSGIVLSQVSFCCREYHRIWKEVLFAAAAELEEEIKRKERV